MELTRASDGKDVNLASNPAYSTFTEATKETRPMANKMRDVSERLPSKQSLVLIITVGCKLSRRRRYSSLVPHLRLSHRLVFTLQKPSEAFVFWGVCKPGKLSMRWGDNDLRILRPSESILYTPKLE